MTPHWESNCWPQRCKAKRANPLLHRVFQTRLCGGDSESVTAVRAKKCWRESSCPGCRDGWKWRPAVNPLHLNGRKKSDVGSTPTTTTLQQTLHDRVLRRVLGRGWRRRSSGIAIIKTSGLIGCDSELQPRLVFPPTAAVNEPRQEVPEEKTTGRSLESRWKHRWHKQPQELSVMTGIKPCWGSASLGFDLLG